MLFLLIYMVYLLKTLFDSNTSNFPIYLRFPDYFMEVTLYKHYSTVIKSNYPMSLTTFPITVMGFECTKNRTSMSRLLLL